MEVLVLNKNFESIAVLDSFKSLVWADRYSVCGDVELYFAMDAALLEFLKEDYYLWIEDSEHCMIIEDIAIDSDLDEGNHLIVTGRSLESILDRRIIWTRKDVNGNLQDFVKMAINESIISPSDEARKIPNFIFEESTDERITKLTVDAEYYGEDLYSIIAGLCEEHEIGFKIILNADNQFVFSLYAGADRSYNQTANPYVVFSPNFDNIIESNYYKSKAKFKNVALVAGEGDNDSRITATAGSASGLDRREVFVDARDLSSTSKLEAKGNESLKKDHKVTTAFEGEVEVTQLFVYGEDFFVGDIVQFADEYGNESAVYISEIVISQDEKGISIRPTFKETTETEGESE